MDESGLQIRAARQADLALIEQLLTACGLPLDGVRDSLECFVVAVVGRDVVGVAGLELCRDNALLRSVAVRADWRARGVGRRLVARVIADAQARPIDALYLHTESAERYFPSFGFHAIGRDAVPPDVRETAEFRDLCPASATIMTRPLRGTPP